jgi:hypothetical protein
LLRVRKNGLLRTAGDEEIENMGVKNMAIDLAEIGLFIAQRMCGYVCIRGA